MMGEIFKRLIQEEEGQGMVEYGLITGLVALIAIAVFASDGALKGAIDSVFAKITSAVNGGGTTP